MEAKVADVLTKRIIFFFSSQIKLVPNNPGIFLECSEKLQCCGIPQN